MDSFQQRVEPSKPKRFWDDWDLTGILMVSLLVIAVLFICGSTVSMLRSARHSFGPDSYRGGLSQECRTDGSCNYPNLQCLRTGTISYRCLPKQPLIEQ